MTTKVTIENAPESNGDVVLNGTSSGGVFKNVVIRPGDSQEVWITTSSALFIAERWPATELPLADGATIAACGDDGAKWAKEFFKRNPSPDEETMRAWFQNAIEAAYDARRSRAGAVADSASDPTIAI